MSEQIITSESLTAKLQESEDKQESESAGEVVHSPDAVNAGELEKEEGESETEPKESEQSEEGGEGSSEEGDEDPLVGEEANTDASAEESNETAQADPLPEWAKKRFKRQENKHRRELEELKQQTDQRINQYIGGVANNNTYFDPNTQIQDPFSGKVVEIDSVEGQVVVKLQQMSQFQQEQDAQTKKQQAQNDLKRKLEKGYDKFEDFDEVVNSIPVSQAMLEAAYLSDNTDELLYNLGKYKPREAERISKLSPEQQFKEMVLLEQTMKSSTKKKIVAKVPEPPTKIKGSGSIQVEPEKMNFEDLLSLRRKKERDRLRR